MNTIGRGWAEWAKRHPARAAPVMPLRDFLPLDVTSNAERAGNRGIGACLQCGHERNFHVDEERGCLYQHADWPCECRWGITERRTFRIGSADATYRPGGFVA